MSSRSKLTRKTEPNLKLYGEGETLEVYPQVNFLGINFDSQLTFKPHLEDILDRCNTRYHRLKLLANKKWGPSPSTSIQIYKQCIRPIFEYGSLSTTTTFDNIVSKIKRLQNKFYRLALRLPKYICQGGHKPGKHGKPGKLREFEKLSKSQGRLREM